MLQKTFAKFTDLEKLYETVYKDKSYHRGRESTVRIKIKQMELDGKGNTDTFG